MAVIKVSKHGHGFAELRIKPGESYTLGRGSDCAVVFDTSKSISRHHVKLTYENERWVATLVSKVGQMLKNDEPVVTTELSPNDRIFVDPYEIQLIEEPQPKKSAPKDLSVSKGNKMASLTPQQDPADASPSEFDLMEHTAVVANPLTAFVTVEDPGGQTRSISLTESSTTFGRDEGNTVQLHDSKVSRKHFEIVQTGSSQYMITDLGSANGTYLNNLELEAHKSYPLTSKDLITVNQTRVTFELRDPKFENMLVQVTPQAPMLDSTASPYAMIPYDYSAYLEAASGPAVVKVTPGGLKAKFMAMPKKTKMRVMLGGVLVFAILISLVSPSKPKTDEASQASINGEPQVSPEQQAVIKDTFNLARNHFMQGKYELCSAEIVKLHAIVPFFENSKELETLCSQAKELQDLEREKERLQKQKEAIEKQVADIVTECRGKLDTFKTEEEINGCLGQAIELDPQNASIEEMRNYLKIKDEEKQAKFAQDQAYQKRVSAGEGKYYSARSLKTKSLLKKAIYAYEEYIASDFPDPKNLKSVAKRELASVRAELTEKLSSKLKICEAKLQQGKFREAILSCDDVLKEDSSHEGALELRRQALANLKRDLKGVYEDAILEESLGNIDAAKDKWKKIVAEDLRDGDYATKSKIKLKKYGVEL